MIKETKFYFCPHCGNIVGMVNDKGVIPHCCGEEMKPLQANTRDGAKEKHIPVYTKEPGCGNAVALHVTVGSTEHPMTEEHYIQWIYVQSEHGGQRKILVPGEKPEADFVFKNDKPVKIFEYCNLHGLYSCDVE